MNARMQEEFKVLLRWADICLQTILPTKWWNTLFPYGGVFNTVKKKYVRRHSRILVRSSLYERTGQTPLYRVAYFNGCPDGGRSERYRVYDQVKFLTREGVLADVYSYGTLGELSSAPFYDLLVLFRANNGEEPKMKALLTAYHRKKIPIIYDVDDNLLERCTAEERQMVVKTIKQCDEMTVSTSYLAEVYRKALGKVCHVIPITISKTQHEAAQALRQKRRQMYAREHIFISYLSGSNSHDADFQEVSPALEQILARHPEVRLVVVGPLTLSKELSYFTKQIVRKKYMPPLDLLALTAEMDINLAPLTMDSFNQGKGETKITEAALVEVVTVASPIASYTKLITHGLNGFLASTLQEWEAILEQLISCGHLRECTGRNAYKDFVPLYCLEHIGNQLVVLHQETIKKKKNERKEYD